MVKFKEPENKDLQRKKEAELSQLHKKVVRWWEKESIQYA